MYTWAVRALFFHLSFFWSEILGQSWSLFFCMSCVLHLFPPTSLLSSSSLPIWHGGLAIMPRISYKRRPSSLYNREEKKKSCMLYMTKRPDHFQTNSKDIPRKTFSCYLSDVSRGNCQKKQRPEKVNFSPTYTGIITYHSHARCGRVLCRISRIFRISSRERCSRI